MANCSALTTQPFAAVAAMGAARPLHRHSGPSAAAAPAVRPLDAPERLDWLDRLATWADSQPPHRRLGAWTLSAR
jgi:hypothetical protein